MRSNRTRRRSGERAAVRPVPGAAGQGSRSGEWAAVRRCPARWGRGAYVVGCLVFTAPLLLVPVASGPPAVVLAMLFAAEFASGFGVMILDISIGAITGVLWLLRSPLPAFRMPAPGPGAGG